MDGQDRSSSAVDRDLLESRHLHNHYSALMCQPYALTYSGSYQELLPQLGKRPVPMQRFKWVEDSPPDMIEAVAKVANKVHEECQSDPEMDWMSIAVNYMLHVIFSEL